MTVFVGVFGNGSSVGVVVFENCASVASGTFASAQPEMAAPLGADAASRLR